MDDILETFQPSEVLAKYTSYELVGKDKFGCPRKLYQAIINLKCKYRQCILLLIVWFCGVGAIDFKGLLLSVPIKDISRLAIWLLERMIREISIANSTNKPGEPRITNQTGLLDLQGLDKKIITNKRGSYITGFIIQSDV